MGVGIAFNVNNPRRVKSLGRAYLLKKQTTGISDRGAGIVVIQFSGYDNRDVFVMQDPQSTF